jgi:tetratricopeptide (TPR) repeat protein
MADGEDYRGLALAVVVGVVGVAVALTLGRVAPEGPEDAALTRARAQRKAGDVVGELSTLYGCVRAVEQPCRCAAATAERLIDTNKYFEALHALRRTAACTSPSYTGGHAEALVATGNTAGGLAEADKTLAQAPDEPHACFAKAWALSAGGSSPEALDLAERAVRGGRGVPALLVLAVLRAGANDRAGARQALDQAARLAPDNPRVAFDLAVVEEKDHHYREAREALLHTLALDPKFADARYELAALAHSVKADDEARHHLEELTKLTPDDPRIPGLRAALAPADKGKPEGAADAGPLVVSRP